MLKDRQVLDANNFLTNMSYDIIAQYRGHLTAERFIFENEKGDKLIVYEVYYDKIHKEKIITFLAKDVSAKENLLKEYLEQYANKDNNIISINCNENNYEIKTMLYDLGFNLTYSNNPIMNLYKK